MTVNCTPSTSGGTGTCSNPVSLTCGTPYNGTTVNGQSNFNHYSCAPQQEQGKEIIHTITLTQASDVTASLSNLNAIDLDVHILSACDTSSCLARGDNIATATNLAAGTYYIVVDGFGVAPAPEGSYTLTVNCTPIPNGPGTCINPVAITCGTPYNGSTVNGQSTFDSYSCGSQAEQGKEIIHTLTLTQASDISAALSNLNGVDLDVQVLSSCDAMTCLGRGNNVANVNALAPGTYYIVVDGFGTGSGAVEGSYTLTVTCTPVSGGGNSGCNELFFSEYLEGTGSNKAIEIYNPTNALINLSSYQIEIYSNGSATATGTITLSGNINAYSTYVVANPNAVAGITSVADVTSGTLNFNGNDAIALVKNTNTMVDLIGKKGENPGVEWVVGGISTKDMTLVRKANVGQGVTTNPATFDPSVEWLSSGIDVFSGLGAHTSDCQSGCTPNSSTVTQSICQGSSYTFGNQTLTTAGTYTETFTNVGGCDSVVTLTLVVNPLPTISAGSDVTVINGTAVTLSGSGGVSYTWTNGVQDGVAFTPAGTNSYIVTGTDANGCQNTDTVVVTVIGGVIQPCSELFFSEYLEGSAQNKALEIYNASSSPIALGSYTIEIFANGASTATTSIPLSGSVPAYGTFVIVNSNASSAILAQATIASASLSFNGNDAILLKKNALDTIDIIGKIGENPGASWSGGGVSTVDMTIRRKSTVQIGLVNNPATFNPSVEWDTFSIDDASDLGNHSSDCSGNTCTDNITLNESICQGQSYTFGSQTLTTSGMYNQTLTNMAGCDSIVTLNLTVTPTNVTVQDTMCAGDTYTFGTQTLTVAGTYSETFTNSLGCDSIVMLELAVANPVTSNITETVCGSSYTFGTQTITQDGTYTEVFQTVHGCDSTVTLDITFGQPVTVDTIIQICQGETYQFGTQTLTQTGSYTEVFTTSGGCDSTVNLTLSVNATPLISITESNGDLVASSGQTYQWYLDGTLLPGATSQNITPTSNGVYTVEVIAFNGCTGTGTYDLQNVGLNEYLSSNDVVLKPNPTKGILYVSAKRNVSVVVYNVIGEVVLRSSTLKSNHTIDLSQNKRGVYMVKIIDESNSNIVKRIVLN